ncbi:DEAD/DEAH box helicase [Jeotgalibacillus sp. S-D1]|uniref:DEAD/DEAH box helicase n=1 Tax=Jeotgalibacillus sp. S-D1 TaxID=2552189 RepID=UPI001F0CEC11|nr:DEAD/DEAH box helicase family protein [Jeotgalibacillus sp. S-D1]
MTKPPAEPVLQWNGTLSKPQQLASEQLITSIQTRQSTLVHAVCGAGKTEILFKAVAYSLSANQQICIATPRRDVVQELFPRFLKAFPTTLIQALYGGSADRNNMANLTIATTHQLYRYSSAFDVMIIDEVDAFPYTMDITLQKAAQNARKPDSALIYLSATPNKAMLAEVKKGSLQSVTIPARYHGYPLPEPQTKWIGNWKKSIVQHRLPYAFQKWLEHRLSSDKTMLIFLADIESMLSLEKILHRFTSKKLCSVHAKDPERSEKIEIMRKKELKILLTTTILERGVTFSNVDVAVLGAEKTIFTESALVQIAGRAGRDYRHPEGNVTFFHYGLTEAIIDAQKHIRMMNRQAAKQGLLAERKS